MEGGISGAEDRNYFIPCYMWILVATPGWAVRSRGKVELDYLGVGMQKGLILISGPTA